MDILFRCEYKLTKQHIRESRRFTLLKYRHLEYVIYAALGVLSLAVIIRSIQVKAFFALFGMVFMYSFLLRHFATFRKMANAIPQEDVYPGESYIKSGIMTATDSGLTFYNDENASEFIRFEEITHLGISVDVMTMYIKGKENKIIPQYSFVEGNKRDFAKMLEAKGAVIIGKFTN